MDIFKDWQPRGEVFRLLNKVYDVDEAKRILAASPRRSETIEGAALNHPLISGDADAEVDITVPVILVTLRGGSPFPIDGWSRIKRAVRTGDTVQYVILTRKETLRVEGKRR